MKKLILCLTLVAMTPAFASANCLNVEEIFDSLKGSTVHVEGQSAGAPVNQDVTISSAQVPNQEGCKRFQTGGVDYKIVSSDSSSLVMEKAGDSSGRLTISRSGSSLRYVGSYSGETIVEIVWSW